MSRKKLKTHRTEISNLINNLRGEIGEIIFSWILMRNTIEETKKYRTSNISDNMENPKLCRMNILIDKLSDEIVSRLSELAERKIGCLNFHFVGIKLDTLDQEIKDYEKFMSKNKFKKKRNYDISHKQLPEQWENHKFIRIPYKILLRGITKSVSLMKKIDDIYLGPSSKYLWREMRKKRYTPIYPIKAGYMVMPYLRLSKENRAQVINEEILRGNKIWESITTIVNGKKMNIRVSKKWGAIILGNRVILMKEYPLVKIDTIDTK